MLHNLITARISLLILVPIFATIIFRSPIVYADKLNDNSFLIEEGYNQEARVIQHIFSTTINGLDKIDFSYTEEWPLFSQRSQISATINWNDYLGNILINYRYQILPHKMFAIAPRLSIVLPVADKKYDEGVSGWGIEANLPISVDLSKRFTLHLNSQLRYDFRTEERLGIVGGSYIFVIFRNFEFLNEYLVRFGSGSTASYIAGGGLRAGLDLSDGLQIVPGIGFYRDLGISGNLLFIYFSIEHNI